MRDLKKIFHANGNQKKAEVAIIILDEIDFKIKIITRDKEVYYTMIQGSIQEEEKTIINIYICPQHRSSSIHEANDNNYKRRYQQ